MLTINPVLEGRVPFRRLLAWVYLVVCLVVGQGWGNCGNVARAAELPARPAVWRVSISRKPLGDALMQLAQELDIQFARFSDADSAPTMVGPLNGVYTRERALDLLLEGTGLGYRFVNERTVAVIRGPLEAPQLQMGAYEPPVSTESEPPGMGGNFVDGKHGGVNVNNVTETPRQQSFWSRILSIFSDVGRDKSGESQASSATRSVQSRAMILSACGVVGMAANCGAAAAEGAGESASVYDLEEVTVTARKRTESIQDVPISISVMSSDEMEKKGILGPKELFNTTPGLHLNDFTGMRKDSRVGIRGVEAADSTVTRQKVSSFIDGVPISGQAGNLSMAGLKRVEVLRGPQSASFGRATFAGAINYVTEDASPDFVARLNAGWSQYGGRDIALTASGPLNDSFGYRVMYSEGHWDGPADWRTQDGVQLGSQRTKSVIAKLNYKFGDNISGSLLYNRHATQDRDYPNVIADPAVCNGDSTITRTRQGAFVKLFNNMYVDCKVDLTRLQSNPDLLGQFKAQYNPALYGNVPLATYLARTVKGGATFEQALLRSTINDPYDRQFRDRVQGELNYELGANTLKFLAMTSHEHGTFWTDRDNTSSIGVFTTSNPPQLDSNVVNRGFRQRLEERYYEARWLSDDAKPLRYVLSASQLSYDYLDIAWLGYGAIVYNLRLPDGSPVDPLLQNFVQESATNRGLSGGLQWDITSRLTASAEGRLQSDKVCGSDPSANGGVGVTLCKKTSSFQPRLSANFKATDSLSFYAQVARGNNPASVNIQMANDAYRNSLLIATGKIVNPADGFLYNGTDPKRTPKVTYTPDTFLTYEEEALDNYEIGMKGEYPDNRGIFSVSLYYMDWKNIQNRVMLDWSAVDVCVNGAKPSSVTGCGSAANTLSYGWNNNTLNTSTNPPVVYNAGSARLYGLELETTYALTPSVTVGGNLTLAKTAHGADYCSLEALQYQNLPASIVFDFDAKINSRCARVPGKDITGVTNNGFPRYSVNANVDYKVPFTPFGSAWKVSLDMHNEGSRYIDELNLTKQRGFTTGNVSSEWRAKGFTVRAYVNNVTNEDLYQYLNNISRNYVTNPANPAASVASAAGGYKLVPRKPREYGLKFGYEFR